MSSKFNKSLEAAWRRFVRDAVRKGNLTRVERDIALVIINLWFHHRNGPEGVIRPGRTNISKKVGCSIKSVSRCLQMMKAAGVLRAVEYEKGGNKATRYKVYIDRLLILCGAELPDWMSSNVPVSERKMSRLTGDKMSHGYIYVQPCPSQSDETDV